MAKVFAIVNCGCHYIPMRHCKRRTRGYRGHATRLTRVAQTHLSLVHHALLPVAVILYMHPTIGACSQAVSMRDDACTAQQHEQIRSVDEKTTVRWHSRDDTERYGCSGAGSAQVYQDSEGR